MSADTLREAARLMRKRAEKATPGRWETTDRGLTHPGVGMDVHSDLEGSVVADCCGYQGGAGIDDAEHIASWHPAVALAVADWLDAYAERLEVLGHAIGSNRGQALAVARAYLGQVTS